MFAAFSCKTIFVTFFAKTLPRLDYENLNQECFDRKNKTKHQWLSKIRKALLV